jgi:HAE1 family hydrophobic/amphiphilic exporter-1
MMQESVIKAGADTSSPVTIKVNGQNLDQLNALADEAALKISSIPGIYGIKTTIAGRSPETKVEVDKERASIYNINVKDIAQTSLIAIKGLTASKFKEAGEEYDITVRLDEPFRQDLTDLKDIPIFSPQGYFVTLAELTKIKRGKGPSEIKRYDQRRVIFVNANLYKEKLAVVSKKVQKVIDSMNIPEGFAVELTGESEEAKQQVRNFLFIITLCFTLVFMIMASQFESLWQPFVIMFTVPFAIIGVAPALFITHTSLNIISLLGMVLLIGVVVNNAIVLIDFVNQKRAEGVPIKEAAIESSIVRLRPILMTAFTSIVGLIPMALATGEGSELRVPMAITVMGGFTTSTVLTVWVIPVLYVTVANFMDKFKRKVDIDEQERTEDAPPPAVDNLQE